MEKFRNLDEACDIITIENIDHVNFPQSYVKSEGPNAIFVIKLFNLDGECGKKYLYEKYSNRFAQEDLMCWHIELEENSPLFSYQGRGNETHFKK
jgi:hypothetical protein